MKALDSPERVRNNQLNEKIRENCKYDSSKLVSVKYNYKQCIIRS